MLHNLPKYAGEINDILLGICNPSNRAIATALGVTERTVQRWKINGAPRIALLALWWITPHGHSVWDAVMHNRTALAMQTNRALWSALADARDDIKRAEVGLTKPGKLLRAANDEDSFLERQPEPRNATRWRPKHR